MKYQIGEVVTVESFAITNQAGGTALIDKTVQIKINDSFYDYETGERYIGELTNEKDIQFATETGKSKFTPEHYKQYGEGMYQDTLNSFNNYNPKKAYFSEFDVIKQ